MKRTGATWDKLQKDRGATSTKKELTWIIRRLTMKKCTYDLVTATDLSIVYLNIF